MKRSVIFLALSVVLSKVCFSQNDCGVCEQLQNNVVKITTHFSDGSDESGFGTIIAEKAGKLYIVTAKHVIYNLDNSNAVSSEINTKLVNIIFYTDQGKNYPAQLLSLSNNIYDITLLEVEKPENFSWTKDFYSNYIVRNTQVWFIGRAGEWYIPTGPNTGAINKVSIKDEIIIDINSIQPGTSGAPLISKEGMVGIIFEDAATDAKAYPIERVKKIITNWNYDWQMNLYTTRANPEPNNNPDPQTTINYDSIATSMSGQWFDDIKNGNVNGLVSSSSVPFYADNKILTSLSEVRDHYTQMIKKIAEDRANNKPILVLTKLKVGKVSELKNIGFDLTQDRFFISMNFEGDPFVGALLFNNNEGLELIFRKSGNSLKIAGEWD